LSDNTITIIFVGCFFALILVSPVGLGLFYMSARFFPYNINQKRIFNIKYIKLFFFNWDYNLECFKLFTVYFSLFIIPVIIAGFTLKTIVIPAIVFTYMTLCYITLESQFIKILSAKNYEIFNESNCNTSDLGLEITKKSILLFVALCALIYAIYNNVHKIKQIQYYKVNQIENSGEINWNQYVQQVKNKIKHNWNPQNKIHQNK